MTTLSRSRRPSPWLLVPAAAALTLLSFAHRDVIFPSLCFLCLAGSYCHAWHASRPKRHPWLVSIVICIALFCLCLLYYRAWLFNGEGLTYSGEGLTSFRRLWYRPWLVSTGAMLQAAVLLWAWHLPSRSTTLIFACMGMIAISSGNILPSSSGIVNLYALFGGSCLLSLLVLSGAFHSGRKQPLLEQCRQSIMILCCIAIIGTGTWYVSTSLQHVSQVLDTLMTDLMPGSSYWDTIGAGDSLYISHQRHVRLSRRVVATLSGSRSPVYLRTQVMTRYQQRRWTPEPASPQLLDLNQHAEHTHMTQDQDIDHRRVQLHVNLQGALPLPYDVARVHVPEPLSCWQMVGGIVHCSPASALASYAFEPVTSHVPVPFGIGFALRDPVTESSLQNALLAPEGILSQLRPLARQIVGTDTTHALAAAQKIQKHFRQHFTYSLDVKLSPKRDPIVDFVTHRRPAYCEYFASGMALMLRALDIPARVVGGFLVWEYNAMMQQWIVRQRDAHAWVEVYDDRGHRWVGFDATPAFRQAHFSRTGLARFFDQSRAWAELRVRHLVNQLSQIDVIAWFMQLRSPKTGLWPIASRSLILVALIVAAYGLWRRAHRPIRRWWQQWRGAVRLRPSRTREVAQAEAQQHFVRLAALLQRRGLPILPTETLQEYLGRCQHRQETPTIFIDGLTAFSHAYHQLRFQPWPTEPEMRHTFLQERLTTIHQALHQLQKMQ